MQFACRRKLLRSYHDRLNLHTTRNCFAEWMVRLRHIKNVRIAEQEYDRLLKWRSLKAWIKVNLRHVFSALRHTPPPSRGLKALLITLSIDLHCDVTLNRITHCWIIQICSSAIIVMDTWKSLIRGNGWFFSGVSWHGQSRRDSVKFNKQRSAVTMPSKEIMCSDCWKGYHKNSVTLTFSVSGSDWECSRCSVI